MLKMLKKYQKPETEIVLLSASHGIMQGVETTSGGSGNVGGDPDDEGGDLANHHYLWELWDDAR